MSPENTQTQEPITDPGLSLLRVAQQTNFPDDDVVSVFDNTWKALGNEAFTEKLFQDLRQADPAQWGNVPRDDFLQKAKESLLSWGDPPEGYEYQRKGLRWASNAVASVSAFLSPEDPQKAVPVGDAQGYYDLFDGGKLYGLPADPQMATLAAANAFVPSFRELAPDTLRRVLTTAAYGSNSALQQDVFSQLRDYVPWYKNSSDSDIKKDLEAKFSYSEDSSKTPGFFKRLGWMFSGELIDDNGNLKTPGQVYSERATKNIRDIERAKKQEAADQLRRVEFVNRMTQEARSRADGQGGKDFAAGLREAQRITGGPMAVKPHSFFSDVPGGTDEEPQVKLNEAISPELREERQRLSKLNRLYREIGESAYSGSETARNVIERMRRPLGKRDDYMPSGFLNSVAAGVERAAYTIEQTLFMAADIETWAYNSLASSFNYYAGKKILPYSDGYYGSKVDPIGYGDYLDQAQATVAQYEQARFGGKTIGELIANGQIGLAAEKLGLAVAQEAPNQFVNILGGRVLGPAFMGASVFATHYRDLLRQGYSHQQAIQAGLPQMAVEFMGEQWGTFGVVDAVERRMIKVLGKEKASKVLGQFFLSLICGMPREGMEEFSTTLGQDFTDYATGIKPDYNFWGSVKQAIDDGIVGFAMGAQTVVQSTTAAYQSDVDRAKRDATSKEQIENGVKMIETMPRDADGNFTGFKSLEDLQKWLEETGINIPGIEIPVDADDIARAEALSKNNDAIRLAMHGRSTPDLLRLVNAFNDLPVETIKGENGEEQTVFKGFKSEKDAVAFAEKHGIPYMAPVQKEGAPKRSGKDRADYIGSSILDFIRNATNAEYSKLTAMGPHGGRELLSGGTTSLTGVGETQAELNKFDPDLLAEIVKKVEELDRMAEFNGTPDPDTQARAGAMSEQIRSAAMALAWGRSNVSRMEGDAKKSGQKELKKLERDLRALLKADPAAKITDLTFGPVSINAPRSAAVPVGENRKPAGAAPETAPLTDRTEAAAAPKVPVNGAATAATIPLGEVYGALKGGPPKTKAQNSKIQAMKRGLGLASDEFNRIVKEVTGEDKYGTDTTKKQASAIIERLTELEDLTPQGGSATDSADVAQLLTPVQNKVPSAEEAFGEDKGVKENAVQEGNEREEQRQIQEPEREGNEPEASPGVLREEGQNPVVRPKKKDRVPLKEQTSLQAHPLRNALQRASDYYDLREILGGSRARTSPEAPEGFKQETQRALDIARNEYGLDVDVEFAPGIEPQIDPRDPAGRAIMEEAGYSQEEIDEVAKAGNYFTINAAHILERDQEGQIRSRIVVFKNGANADSIGHEIAHALDENGGMPRGNVEREEFARRIGPYIADQIRGTSTVPMFNLSRGNPSAAAQSIAYALDSKIVNELQPEGVVTPKREDVALIQGLDADYIANDGPTEISYNDSMFGFTEQQGQDLSPQSIEALRRALLRETVAMNMWIKDNKGRWTESKELRKLLKSMNVDHISQLVRYTPERAKQFLEALRNHQSKNRLLRDYEDRKARAEKIGGRFYTSLLEKFDAEVVQHYEKLGKKLMEDYATDTTGKNRVGTDIGSRFVRLMGDMQSFADTIARATGLPYDRVVFDIIHDATSAARYYHRDAINQQEDFEKFGGKGKFFEMKIDDLLEGVAHLHGMPVKFKDKTVQNKEFNRLSTQAQAFVRTTQAAFKRIQSLVQRNAFIDWYNGKKGINFAEDAVEKMGKAWLRQLEQVALSDMNEAFKMLGATDVGLISGNYFPVEAVRGNESIKPSFRGIYHPAPGITSRNKNTKGYVTIDKSPMDTFTVHQRNALYRYYLRDHFRDLDNLFKGSYWVDKSGNHVSIFGDKKSLVSKAFANFNARVHNRTLNTDPGDLGVLKQTMGWMFTARLNLPDKITRNLLQNLAYDFRFRDFVNTFNSLDEKDKAYFVTHVTQEEGLMKDQFFVGTHSTKIKKAVNKFYAMSDQFNRLRSFKAHLPVEKAAWQEFANSQMTDKDRDRLYNKSLLYMIRPSDQMRAWEIAATETDGALKAAQFVTERVVSANNFLYVRYLRSPTEQSERGEALVNLLTYQKGMLHRMLMPWIALRNAQTSKRKLNALFEGGFQIARIAATTALLNFIRGGLWGGKDDEEPYGISAIFSDLPEFPISLSLSTKVVEEQFKNCANAVRYTISGDWGAAARSLDLAGSAMVPMYEIACRMVEVSTGQRMDGPMGWVAQEVGLRPDTWKEGNRHIRYKSPLAKIGHIIFNAKGTPVRGRRQERQVTPIEWLTRGTRPPVGFLAGGNR